MFSDSRSTRQRLILAAFLGVSYCTTHATGSPTCRRDHLGPLDPNNSNFHIHPQCTTLIDDTSSHWAPWTHRPKCAYAQKGRARYCVFTYDRVVGKSGVSVLATPQVAAEVGGHLQDRDPTWLHPQSRTYHLRTDDGPPPYYVREIPGKGKGAIANRTIRGGELILREHPIIINLSELPRGIVPSQVGPMFDVAFDQLPETLQGRIRDMARTGTGNLLNDVQNSNAFGVSMGENQLAAVAPEIARFNHACRPNVFTRFIADTLTFEAVAYADIQEGEELTLSYLPLNLLSEGRKREIQAWHFNCTCSLCASDEANKESDRNKMKVQKILDKMKDKKNRVPAITERLFKELTEIIETERLQAESGNFASLLAGLYFQMQNLEEAKRYAAMAVDNHTHYVGHDSSKAKRAREAVEFLNSMRLE